MLRLGVDAEEATAMCTGDRLLPRLYQKSISTGKANRKKSRKNPIWSFNAAKGQETIIFNKNANMQIQDYFSFLDSDDIRIKGSRIGIESVLYEYIYRARTPEEIAQQFETITLEQVHATILYYLHNKEEVSAYLADWLEFCRQQREEQKQNPSPARQRFRQMKAEVRTLGID